MIQDTRYIFFGTPEFAAIVLNKLIVAGFIPEAIVCNPDRPAGRKKILTSPPVKLEIRKQKLENRIEVLQPENPSDIIPYLSEIKPDIFIVAAYAKILPKGVVGIPKLGAIGVHPSLLPKYRGASPIQSAILNGEEKTGVTLYLLDEKMDHGEIVSSIKYQVSSSDTYKTLEKKLAGLGGNLLAETLPKFLNGEIKPMPQNESEATYTKKISTQDAFVDENKLNEAVGGKNREVAEEIYGKILALTPEPGVWTLKGGKRIKLLEAGLRNGNLILKVIQTEGQKPVNL